MPRDHPIVERGARPEMKTGRYRRHARPPESRQDRPVSPDAVLSRVGALGSAVGPRARFGAPGGATTGVRWWRAYRTAGLAGGAARSGWLVIGPADYCSG